MRRERPWRSCTRLGAAQSSWRRSCSSPSRRGRRICLRTETRRFPAAPPSLAPQRSWRPGARGRGRVSVQQAAGAAAGSWTYPFLLKQTFTKLVQLQVGSNGLTTILAPPTPSIQYLDNVIVGPKFHFLDQGKFLPSLALTLQASIPSFESKGYVRVYDAFVTGHASKDVGPIHADFNVAAYLWGIDDAPRTQVFTALAFSMGLAPPLGAAVEVYDLTDASPWASKDGGVRTLLTVTPRPWLVFDYRRRRGILHVRAGVHCLRRDDGHPGRVLAGLVAHQAANPFRLLRTSRRG